MTKFHNLKYSLIAFIIFSIITPMVLSQAKISDGADFYILYWLFSVLALIPANIAYRKGCVLFNFVLTSRWYTFRKFRFRNKNI